MVGQKKNTHFPTFPLAELHAHLGASINPSVFWQIAHAQGFKLPKKEYQEFIEYVTLSPHKKRTLSEYLDKIYHPLLDKLSSGTYAVGRATYEVMSGAYRNNISLIELRSNPMRHNNEGEQDLDHLIIAMLHGMEKALLEYPNLSAGLIFCLAREFSFAKNEIIVQKAIKYRRRGIVGIDFAGAAAKGFRYKDYQKLAQTVKQAGLNITCHSGEVANANDIWEVIEYISPSRIGHGIKAAYDKKLMKELVKRSIVLEVCPFSNLMTNAVENEEELKFILRTFIENNVLFTINTDWPEIIEGAHLYRQFAYLRDFGFLTEKELKRCNIIAFERAFAKKGGLEAYL